MILAEAVDLNGINWADKGIVVMILGVVLFGFWKLLQMSRKDHKETTELLTETLKDTTEVMAGTKEVLRDSNEVMTKVDSWTKRVEKCAEIQANQKEIATVLARQARVAQQPAGE